MEDKLKKQKIRKILIGVVVLILATFAIKGFSFEGADYNKELNAQIMNAEKVFNEAEIGNDKGQYSEYVVASFAKEIGEAKEYLAKDADKKELKKEYKALKETTNEFQQSMNDNVLGADEIKKLKKDGDVLTKEVEFGDKEVLTWTIDAASVEKAVPVNLDVDVDTLYNEKLTDTRKTLKKEGRSVAFMHNGTLPFKSAVKMSFESNEKEVQIYHYDTKTGTYGELIKGSVKGNTLSFEIEEGGVYMILNSDTKDAEKVRKELDKATEKAAKAAKAADEKDAAKEDGKEDKKADNKKETTDGKTDSASSSSSSSSKPSKPSGNYCTVEIRCDTIADHSKITNAAIIPYVPSSGVILGTTEVLLEDGDTAFDVLQRVTRQYGIQMEFSYSSVYDSAYIEGINNIYEFDAGGGSGWMYKVNGWFPNYGCSNYELKNGDTMVWCYTTNIGKDVGDQYYEDHPDANPEYE